MRAFRRARPWLATCGATVVLAALLYPRLVRGQSSNTARSQQRSPAAPSVTTATATIGNLPVYLTGLGTVTPLQTVTVKTRVDGQLMSATFREGQLVHQGDLLLQIDPRPFQVQLAQAQGQLAKDQAALEDAKLDLQRYQALIEQDSIPRQQLDSQVALVHQYEGAIKSDVAQVDNARLNLTYSRITAPITGRIGLRLVDPGNIVHASDPSGLVSITQVQPIAVVFTIPQDNLPAVLAQLHAGAQLRVDALNRDLSTTLATGSLQAVDNTIDPTTGTVKLKASFANRDDALFPSQFVNARLLVDTLKGLTLVPTAAIQRNTQSTFVYVVTPDRTVEIRNVAVRLTEGNQTALANGVAVGERVVIDGVDKLQPGIAVTVRTP